MTSSLAALSLPTESWLSRFHALRRPLLVAHVTPDSDAIGSALGLATAMRERGIDATVGLPAVTVAKKLEFLLELAPDTPRVDAWSTDAGFDGVIILDTAASRRVNLEGFDIVAPGLSLNIDHHITNDGFATDNWIDGDATSTCEMVGRMLTHLGWSISSPVATLLYAGIHGDTAGFSLPSTTPASMQVAADLLAAGADVGLVGEQLCRSQARSDFEILRKVYDNTKLTADGQLAYSFLTHADFLEAGAKAEDIDDQVGVPMALKGVHMALLFTEGHKGTIRINLRGEGDVRVVELAQQFGGGGHAQAAGVKINDRDIHDVIEEVVAAAQTSIKQQT